MDRYGPETYGEQMADVYDEWHAGMDPAATVDVLASLAGSGPVLELGIGTGRVAIPLAARGLEVHGIDASPAMVERLRAKPGGGGIGVTFGHLADVAVDRSFPLAFIVFTRSSRCSPRTTRCDASPTSPGDSNPEAASCWRASSPMWPASIAGNACTSWTWTSIGFGWTCLDTGRSSSESMANT